MSFSFPFCHFLWALSLLLRVSLTFFMIQGFCLVDLAFHEGTYGHLSLVQFIFRTVPLLLHMTFWQPEVLHVFSHGLQIFLFCLIIYHCGRFLLYICSGIYIYKCYDVVHHCCEWVVLLHCLLMLHCHK